MRSLRITATEFARNLSSYLSEVRYRSVSLEVWRGRELVARVAPPDVSAAAGFPIERLNGFMASLPRLEPDDAQAFVDDLDRLDQTVGVPDGDPWGS